jgi:hypothetical protein
LRIAGRPQPPLHKTKAAAATAAFVRFRRFSENDAKLWPTQCRRKTRLIARDDSLLDAISFPMTRCGGAIDDIAGNVLDNGGLRYAANSARKPEC